MASKDYVAILLEDLRGQLVAVLEYAGEIPGINRDVAQLKVDVSELKSDMKVIKKVLVSHEKRITHLETLRN